MAQEPTGKGLAKSSIRLLRVPTEPGRRLSANKLCKHPFFLALTERCLEAPLFPGRDEKELRINVSETALVTRGKCR